MKKMLIIIFILLIIFVCTYMYKTNMEKNNGVTVSEVNEIEEYISKIYMWQEITEQALPKFDNINDAPDLWTWEVVKKNLENYEISYEEIDKKAKELFGDQFTKKFPKEGTEYIQYNEELKKYITTGIGLDILEDNFFIKNITKTKTGYEVEIVEYLEDYENSMNINNENEIYDIYIKDLNHNIISTIKSSEGESKLIEEVKNNIDKFTTKKIALEKNKDRNLYVRQVGQT